jgi:unsaturated chondroitin disaccharide hydrolase
MKLSEALNKAINKVDKNRGLKEFPYITENGKWITTNDGYWTGGFWIGLLWFSYKTSGDKKYKKLAYNWLNVLEKRKNDKTMLFDLGFMFFPSFVLGYKITSDNYLKSVALDAADTLSTFFNERSGFVCHEITINGKRAGRTIIDVMMNLPLLWWAYEETDDKKYYNTAYTHSKRTIEEFIRDDLSTIHVIDFDLENGEIIRKITGQGYSDESCWSRGHAWAIYGFTLAYKTSKDEIFLEVAEKLAEYFTKDLPDDYVPYWDFNDPNPSVKDSSAAAIACSGLVTLYELTSKEKYKEIASKILISLSTNYLSEEGDGILKHGCFYKPKNIGVDESLMWGDYYFVEAIIKVLEEVNI